MNKAIETLQERGFFNQCTDLEALSAKMDEGPVTFYVGADPTGPSLHIGHMVPFFAFRHLMKFGHKGIALIGGGTGRIGDPSGKTEMRKMLTYETIDANVENIKNQLDKFLHFDGNNARAANNKDWLEGLNYIDFLRDIGSCFSVNKMLTAECYKQRMERGLSFLEFNYMIMQSYDFLELYRRYGCNMQFGGDDQWSNMLGGTELIRKKLGKDAYAMTITLLLNSEGKKMGKTEKGAVWLDAEKTSPYEFFQYWRNVGDADVIKCLKMLTFLPIEEIEEMERTMQGAELNKAKEILAYELTKLVHGEEEANKALEAAKNVFGGSGNSDNMPTVALAAEDLTDGKIGILDLLVKSGLCSSKRDARTTVEQKGAAVNDEIIADVTAQIEIGDFIILRKGKKNYRKITK